MNQTLITANVTEPINAGGLWNTTMTYNSTTQLWTQTIPGQSSSTSKVQFFMQAYDNAGNLNTGSTNSYQIKNILLGDLNGNGIVDLTDLVLLASHYGQHSP